MAEHGESTRVEFVPFGVDERAFVPSLAQPAVDVVMAGADPHRDVDLFVGLAAEMPSRIVSARDDGRSRAHIGAAAEPRRRVRHLVRVI